MTLSILIWLPLAVALIAALAPRRATAAIALLGSVATLAVAISFVARFKTGHAGLQFVTDRMWISALGIHYKLGLDGLNVALVLLTTVLFTRRAGLGGLPRVGAPRRLLLPLRPGPERRARRLLRPGPRAVRGLL